MTPMETPRRILGTAGESAAAEYLGGLGHAILERNWRSGHLELDLVTLDQNGLHFVEVKSRVAPLTADPLAGMTGSKQRSMANAARRYLREHSCGDIEIFLDVVTVLFDGERTVVEYFPQAVIPIHL